MTTLPDEDGGEIVLPGRVSVYDIKRRPRKFITMEIDRLARDAKEHKAALRKIRERTISLWFQRIFAP